MNSKAFRWGARSIAVLTLAMSTGAQAQAPCPEHLSGIISDYTPYNSAAVAPTPTGPYEMRGRWAVHLKEHEGKGDFSAPRPSVRPGGHRSPSSSSPMWRGP